MASGDLEARVEIEGSDEVADMAAALEVFRLHALEVQRLNLVEKLAEDLRGKNFELEAMLADLRQARNQIVMREELAALGELTVGVAHEIKNPLNFVKNFSEVSEELLEELKEVLPESSDPLNDDQRDEIQEILSDLTGNLECIRQRGDRANRIVHDMLMMGLGSSEQRPVQFKSLVREHMQLAYHSAQATVPDFQVHIEEDFNQDMGEMEVVPQHLGRVVLNMLSNSCHATDQKRRAATEPYVPTPRLATRRNGDRGEIRVRDNCGRIPDEVREKMFNPFSGPSPRTKARVSVWPCPTISCASTGENPGRYSSRRGHGDDRRPTSDGRRPGNRGALATDFGACLATRAASGVNRCERVGP